MSNYTRVGAVTGANKGIGLAIVRQLALQYPSSAYNNGPLLIYLTARNKERGEAALADIHSDSQLKKAQALRADGGLADIKYLPLDIDSQESIKTFAATIKEAHPDGIDFHINNAGIAMNGFDLNVVKQTTHCNYYGTLAATQLLLPQIRDGGRLVNVASTGGRLKSTYSSAIKKRFLTAKSVEDITQLMEEYKAAVADGSYMQTGWPGQAYGVTKAGVIGATQCIARDNAKSGSKTLVNSCCPGYVATDMTRGGGVKTPDQGAQTPVTLALGDIKGANGQFWYEGRETNWES